MSATTLIDETQNPGHVREFTVDPFELIPSEENYEIYRRENEKSPEFLGLVESVRREGIREPIVITEDNYIVSGHRRTAAAIAANLGLVPVRRLPYRKQDDPERHIRSIREFNRQRVKTSDELVREVIVDIDPKSAHAELRRYRDAKPRPSLPAMALGGRSRRDGISEHKNEFIDAIRAVLRSVKAYLPVSLRTVHYQLLNAPPLIHSGKADSRYRNDVASYKSLSDLLTRARLLGIIDIDAIDDETRAVETWAVWKQTAPFVERVLDGLFRPYWRDLQQSQPHQIELVVEKNTMGFLRKVAANFTVPMTIGRGFSSLPPRHKMAERYRTSGKDHLIILVVSDHDPEGYEIAEAFARSMRDDFRISRVHAYKVALTAEQVDRFKLPPGGKAKTTSSRCAKFTKKYGEPVYELEALPPATLEKIVSQAIESSLDVDAFNRELAAEERDAQFLKAKRLVAIEAIGKSLANGSE